MFGAPVFAQTAIGRCSQGANSVYGARQASQVAGARAQTPKPSARAEHHHPAGGGSRSGSVRQRVATMVPTGIDEQRVSPGSGRHAATAINAMTIRTR